MTLPKELLNKKFNLELDISTTDLDATIINLDDFSVFPEQVVDKALKIEASSKIIKFTGIQSDSDTIVIRINSAESSTIKTNLSNCKTYFITFRSGVFVKTVPLFVDKVIDNQFLPIPKPIVGDVYLSETSRIRNVDASFIFEIKVAEVWKEVGRMSL